MNKLLPLQKHNAEEKPDTKMYLLYEAICMKFKIGKLTYAVRIWESCHSGEEGG